MSGSSGVGDGGGAAGASPDGAAGLQSGDSGRYDSDMNRNRSDSAAVTEEPKAVSESHRLTALFKETRSRTRNMVSTLEPDDFTIQTAFFTSPAKWHIGHVSWIYEAIMGKIDKEYGFEEGEISAYLNSYYQQFGAPHDKGRRGAVSRPTTRQMFEYFEGVSGKVERFVAKHRDAIDGAAGGDRAGSGGGNGNGNGIGNGNAVSDTARLLEMGIHHECQHQELMVYDLQHMLADRYVPAPAMKRPAPQRDGPRAQDAERQALIEGGLYAMGYGGSGYCYDIELPEHKTYLEPYLIDVYPITNGQYMEFVEDGGYDTYRYWLSDGWEKVRENGWEAPMYWERGENGEWHTRDFAGCRQIDPMEPVCHVSYYEADAYAKWAGKRLPTEAEWEMAACWNRDAQRKNTYPWGDGAPTPDRCNLLESGVWKGSKIGSYPEGASSCGCQQMIGDVWEWTSSEFVGYPGFKSGFDEYNDKWFANQKVLRGGSFGTPAASIRASYRNFFKLDERWMIAGLRCAQDAVRDN